MATLRKRGTRWQAQIRRKNTPPITKSFYHKADALAWARELEVEIDRRRLKHDPRELDKLTLVDLLQRYAKYVSPSKKGGDIELIRLEGFQKFDFSTRTLNDLSPADFAGWRDRRAQQVSNSTVLRELALLHHVFEMARTEWGYHALGNPLALVRKPKANPPRERRLKDGEYVRLLQSAKQARTAYLSDIIILAVETAMRRSEILRVKSEDISCDFKRLQITQAKNGYSRSIPLSDEAVAAFKRLYELFQSPYNNPIIMVTPNALRLNWDRCVRRAGITDLHFHDLRHEAVSRLFESGLSVPEVASISGHRDYRMLARYTHVMADGA